MESSVRVYRHPLPVRIWHWVNALCLFVLLLSGLQIFNSHPRLYLGNDGYYDHPQGDKLKYGNDDHWGHDIGSYDYAAVFEIGGSSDLDNPQSWVRIGSIKIPTTHILGVVEGEGAFKARQAFPSWLRLPSKNHLGIGRSWHFMMAWLLFISISSYLLYLFASSRLVRVLLPSREQMHRRAILRDLWMHMRLKHATGKEALKYNLLQKLSYLGVLFILLPTMIATGMTMSNSAVAAFPWLIDLFQGRQTARTIHFICAMLLLSFFFIHLFQVFVAGFRREMRSIITGYYVIPEELPVKPKEEKL
jgi:thiosulfate reductase cytochrome b subunit